MTNIFLLPLLILPMYNINITKPFGPFIFECMCPQNVVTNFNSFVDNMDQNTKELCSSRYSKVDGFPDLLDRGFEIIYLTSNQCENVGFTSFIGDIVPEYMKLFNVNNTEICFTTSHFSDLFVEVWVNRYFKDDYTPPHDHKGHISGITILDLPEDSDWFDLHNLEFIWNNEHHRPDQEIGKTFLFPSNLMHWVTKQKSLLERRTVSFNLVVNIPQ
jgi:hypothetical protein